MTPEELTDLAFDLFAPDDSDNSKYIIRREHMIRAINVVINDKLEEAAQALEALESGTYTSSQTPAGLVRAMKVKE